jgi:hypothetical protein
MRAASVERCAAMHRRASPAALRPGQPRLVSALVNSLLAFASLLLHHTTCKW